MAKKYIPSGYQIIDIIIPVDVSSGDTVTPETEDEKLLYDLLVKSGNKEKTKPVLLNITLGVDGNAHISGFGSIYDSSLTVYAGNEIYFQFNENNGGIQYNFSY